MKTWRVLSSKPVLETPWFRIRQDAVRLPNGLELDDYYVIETPHFVKVFGFTEAGEVVFVRQYKHGLGRVVLELPAGFIERGEDPAHAAARELLEETGYAGQLECVARWAFDPTRTPTIEHLFFGCVARVAAPAPDSTEDIDVVLIPASDIPAWIARGDLDALSSIAAALHCLPLMTH